MMYVSVTLIMALTNRNVSFVDYLIHLCYFYFYTEHQSSMFSTW